MTKHTFQYYTPFPDNAATLPLGVVAAQDPKWRPEIYKHGYLGPLGVESLEEKRVEMDAFGGDVACEHCHGFWGDSVADFTKHFARNRGCQPIRALEFWTQRGFKSTNLATRFPKICAQAGLEVWRDVLRSDQYQSTSMRNAKVSDQNYLVWLPTWAMDIWKAYHAGELPPGSSQRLESKSVVAARKLDTPNDWLMFHTLEIANTDTEFRNAVRGLQRNTSSPWDQRDALADWIASRGHKKPSSFPSHRRTNC